MIFEHEWRYETTIHFSPFLTTEVPIYRNQSTDLLSKAMDWFLNDRDLRHERVKWALTLKKSSISKFASISTIKKAKVSEHKI